MTELVLSKWLIQFIQSLVLTTTFLTSFLISPVDIAPPPPAVMPLVKLYSEEWVKQRIEHYADFYGISAELMNWVVKCESNYKINAVGDNGHSFGLVQIHLMSWKDAGINYEMANNPEFTLDFLARKLKEGNGYLWTCFRMLPEE